MKPSPANLWQRLPGPASWEWWSRPGGAPEPVASEEGPRGQAPAVYGFAARDCESVPVWVSSAEPEIIAQFLAVEMERLGVRLPAGSGRHLGWHTVTSDGPRRLIQAIVVPEALDPDAAKSGATNWTAFRPSPLFFKPPARAITLWKENGHWIAGFENHEQWVHFQPLGPSELGEDLLRDVECLHLELDGRRIIGPVDSLVIWTDGEPVWAAFRDLTHEILGLPVRVAPKPPPNPALADDDAWDFEPATVALERERRETAGRWFRVASIAAVLYILLIGAGVVSLTLQRKKNAALSRQLAELEPAARIVRVARDRWNALEPALAVDRYPVELFHRVAELFPERGLRMTVFEVREDGQIVVRGEASSVPIAIGFKADLENAPTLKDYEWNIPPPVPEGDIATFSAFGTYRYGKTNES